MLWASATTAMPVIITREAPVKSVLIWQEFCFLRQITPMYVESRLSDSEKRFCEF